jgi:transposase
MAVAKQRAGRPSYGELEALVAEQAAVIETLRAQIAVQDARIAELEGRLGSNSRNSSRPPSSDGYEKPAPKSLRRSSGRKPGGQPGSPGHRLARSEPPDRSVLHRAERCDGCGGISATRRSRGSESRQVFDLPELPRLGCVEHWIQRRRCGCCGEVTSSRFPAGVNAPVQYGPRVRALGIYLVCYQHLPYERVAQLLSDVLGAGVSVGSLQAFVAQGAEGLGGFLDELRGQLQGAPVAQFDETGARIDGKLGWVHSASTVALTLYVTHPRRGVDGIDAAGVLPGFAGTAVHDGWAPYRAYEDATHALCNAHHLRELIGAEEQGQAWALGMSCLLLDAKALVEQARADGLRRLADTKLTDLHASYRAVIALGHEQHPGLLVAGSTGRRPKRTKAQNLLLRLDEREQDVLRFAHDLRVPFDNNLSERDLRMIKLQQKISGCWRTREGAERFLKIRSYVSTARKQGQRPLTVLAQLTAGEPWLPAPAPT